MEAVVTACSEAISKFLNHCKLFLVSSVPPPVFKWFVLYTKPNFEKKIYASLLQRGFICFLPLKKTSRNWSDRKKIIEMPLFPNYLFVYTTLRDRFKVLEVTSAASYVNYNGAPATISDKDLVTVKKMMSDPSVIIEDYLNGDPVEIVDGPFNGLTGIVFEKKGKFRFGVELKSINKSLSAEFNIVSLKKI